MASTSNELVEVLKMLVVMLGFIGFLIVSLVMMLRAEIRRAVDQISSAVEDGATIISRVLRNRS